MYKIPKTKAKYACSSSICEKISTDTNEFKLCGRCKLARYCCKRCQKYDYAENVHNEDCMIGTCMLFHGIRPQYLFSIYSGIMESGKSNQLNYHHSEQSVVESSLRRVKDFSCTVLSCCIKRPEFMIELHQRVTTLLEKYFDRSKLVSLFLAMFIYQEKTLPYQ